MRRVPAILSALWLAYTLLLLLWQRPPAEAAAASTLVVIVAQAACGFFVWRTSGHLQPRAAWRAIAAALFLGAFSWALWFGTSMTGSGGALSWDPSYVLVLFAYGLVGWGILRFAQGPARTQLRRQALLDATIIGSSFIMLLGTPLHHLPPFENGSGTWNTWYELTVPLGSVFLLTLLVLALGRAHPSSVRTVSYLAVAAAVTVLTDSLSWLSIQSGVGPSILALQGLWIAPAGIVAAAAATARSRPIHLGAQVQFNRAAQLVLPYTVVGLGLAAGIAEFVRHGQLHPVVLAAGAIMVGALLARLMLSLRDNIRLNEHLRRAASTASEKARLARAEQRHHEAILNSLGDAILVLDAQGRIRSANGAVQQLFAVAPEALAGQDVHALLDWGEGTYANTARTSPTFHTEAFSQDGQRIQVEVTVPPTTPAGAPDGQLLIVRDITDRIRADQERERRAKQAAEVERLRETNRFKSNFLNMAAHELGTPLTPIKIQLHLLQQDDEADPETRHQSLSILTRNVDRLALLVRELLDAARIQSSRLVMKREPLRIRNLILEACESYRSVAAKANVRLDVRVHEDQGLVGDGPRLLQVLNNLLSNAIKYTPSGGTVTIESHRYDDAIVIGVHDTGKGIRAEDVDRLFLPFSRLDDRTREGNGLGLYICKGIVDASGGRIWCEGHGEGRGASFFVQLPRSPKPLPDTGGRAAAIADPLVGSTSP